MWWQTKIDFSSCKWCQSKNVSHEFRTRKDELINKEYDIKIIICQECGKKSGYGERCISFFGNIKDYENLSQEKKQEVVETFAKYNIHKDSNKDFAYYDIYYSGQKPKNFWKDWSKNVVAELNEIVGIEDYWKTMHCIHRLGGYTKKIYRRRDYLKLELIENCRR